MLEKASLLLSQARGAYQREQYTIALAYFRRACQVDEHNPEALLGIGEVAAYLDLRDEAVTAFLDLANVYTQAGMLEVAADVIERILEIEPAQPVARRFQAFIHNRIRRPTGDTSEVAVVVEDESAVTAVERPMPLPLPASPMVRLPTQISEELPHWEEEEGVSIDSIASTQASTSVVNRDLDKVLGELGVTRIPARRGTFAFADTMVAARRPRADDFDSEAGHITSVKEDRQVDRVTDVDPPRDAQDMTVVNAAPGQAFTSAPLAGNPPHPAVSGEEAFSDVSTRLAPDGLMQQLARAEDDPFSAATRVGAVPELAMRVASPDPETTLVDPEPPVHTATGSGQHEVDVWEVDTVAAVNAENIRPKPQLSLNRIEFKESDFPKFEEGAPDTELVTRTIALEGEGAAAAIAGLMSISPLLAPLDAASCQQLLSGSEVMQCFAGQTIVHQGDSGSSMFLLVTGKAAVERTTTQAARRVASISAGAFFGEGSLLADAPRNSTIRIIEDALVLEFGRDLIQSLVVKRPRLLTVLTRFLRARLLSALMMDSPLFDRLPASERTKLAPRVHLHKLTPGQTVAERGQVLTGFCTIMAGRLKKFGVAEGTGRQNLGTLGPGSAFGSRSLVDEPSSVDIVAETGCWLLRLPTEDLAQLVSEYPELVEALAEAERATFSA